MHNAGGLQLTECGHFLHARSARHQAHTGPGGDHDLLQGFFAAQKVAQVVVAAAAQGNLGIGQAQIGVQQHHALAHQLQCNREVHGHGGFADTTLAAGDADNLRSGELVHEIFQANDLWNSCGAR